MTLSSPRMGVLIGIVVGMLGGAALAALGLAAWGTEIVLGGIFGLAFALLVLPRATSPGSGLLWGLGYAVLLWLTEQQGDAARLGGAPAMYDLALAQFPDLIGYILCIGAPLGLALGTWGARRPNSTRQPFNLPRALVVGGVAGIVGGWAFGKWMEQIDFFPLVATLVGSTSTEAGMTLHFIFAIIIGATFGLLFQRDVRSAGSCLGWGVGYGIFWWFLGPLTILPLWLGRPLDWSAQQGGALFGSLVGHIVYGLIVGLVYAVVDKLWIGFFHNSDPLNREVEGPGVRALNALGWSVVASLVGGVAV